MPQRKCACGCGEWLSPTAKRDYRRGHAPKSSPVRPEKEETTNVQDVFAQLPDKWEAMDDPFQTLIENLPDDPEPDQNARDRASGIIQPDGTTIVTKQMAKDIQGKVAFLLSMPASMLQPLDPICMPVLLQQVPDISAKLTPIICQSPDMVKFFTKGGAGFILWLNLAVSVWPVLQVVIAHHIAKSVGHEKDEETNGFRRTNPDFNQYQA